MIDLEYCTILGDETVDANSINRCMFNLHRKMVDMADISVNSKSENIPSSPFFSGGYDNALTDIDYIEPLSAVSADQHNEGVVARIYCGDFDIYGKQNDQSFSTESETGTYYYSSEELSTFAPSVSSLYTNISQMSLRSILFDDESDMVTGVKSLGNATSPLIKFTSYRTCSNSGVSFGTITFSRNNGDRQNNTVTLNIVRDMIGMDSVESVDFFTIGNGFSSGVKTVSDTLDMVSEIGGCTVTLNSDNEIILSNITKSDNSDVILVEKDSGRIVEGTDGSYGKYIELSNDEVVLNFFTMFTLKENPLEYSDDLWCFYVVSDFSYGKRFFNDANGWAQDYFRYSFDNFELADDGMVMDDGSHIWDGNGCVVDASDAFNGCYNASFKSLMRFSPALKYAERMFKGCTRATFDSLPNKLDFQNMRSAESMFENCITATFSNITEIDVGNAYRTGMMFSGCTNADFNSLSGISLGGNATKMFYGDGSADFSNLETISGKGTRMVSMFEGCDNANFRKLEKLESTASTFRIDATRMFYGLENPKFDKIDDIRLGYEDDSMGYIGESMFEGCINSTFENLTGVGNVIDGTRMFAGCDPYTTKDDIERGMNRSISTFESLTSVGERLEIGKEMFRDNYFLNMTITGDSPNLKDGTSMFANTSSVVLCGEMGSLELGSGMFSHTVTAHVYKNLHSLKRAGKTSQRDENYGMFENVSSAMVLGNMDSLVEANSMFRSSDEVDVAVFPSTVYNASFAFANISKWCNISSWESTVHIEDASGRYCDSTFYDSNNVSITGDVLAGDVYSTSRMFESVKGLVLCNQNMEGPTDRIHQFYSTEGGENFVYVQGYDESGRDGGFIFAGNTTKNDIGSAITSSISGDVQNSLFIASKLKSRDVEYSIYSVEPSSEGTYGGDYPSVELETMPIVFNSDSIVMSSDYAYSEVSGYTSATIGYSTEFTIGMSVSTEITSYDFYKKSYITNDISDFEDNRTVSITSFSEGNIKYCFSEFLSEDVYSDILSGNVEYNNTNTFKVNIGNESFPLNVPSNNYTFAFDFIQISSSNNTIRPQIVIEAVDSNGGGRNAFAIIPGGEWGSGNGNPPKIMNLGISDYEKLIIENSKNIAHSDLVEVHKYDDESLYGYLMRYEDFSLKDNRLIFSKYLGDGNIASKMMRSPKYYRGDFTVASIFGSHNFSDDIPFKEEIDGSRVCTRFSFGNADMAGTWTYADSMFRNVVEDSLLSGYHCFTDTSLSNVSHMFAIDDDSVLSSYEPEDDKTFRYSGYLLQNLRDSSVTDMDGMFLNRHVCEPCIFKDIYNQNGDYISFNIPNYVTNATSAFMNCSISLSSEVDSKSFEEIGLDIPPTLKYATDMFKNYNGPLINLGYGSDGTIYISDGFECDGMFYGCHFSDSEDVLFGFDVPSIYIDMFDGSDFKMDGISSLNVRNGMNFANPYDNDTFFYNGMKILGCSSISFDSLRTDIIDWFCTDTSDVEGVYLATVIGPVNDIHTTDGKPLVGDIYTYSSGNYLSGDYRLMYGRKVDSGGGDLDWKTYMSSRRGQFPMNDYGNEMIRRLYDSTNELHMNMMTEIANKRARMTCMFNLPILFDNSNEFLGDILYLSTAHDSYVDTYNRLSDERFIGKTYNGMTFDLVENIDAVEMPFAFAGLSSATFDRLSSISQSNVMGYGAFMNCKYASFDSLSSIRFIQDGECQLNTMESRFSPKSNMNEWYGNYCNMFAGCSSASMSSLQSINLNSWYSTYDSGNSSVMMWFDTENNINYTTRFTFNSRFILSFRADSDSNTIHISISDEEKRKFFDYDTLCSGESTSSIDVRFSKHPLDDEVLVKISLIPNEYGAEPFVFYADTLGNISTDPSGEYVINRYDPEDVEHQYVPIKHFIENYTEPLTGNTEGEDTIGRTYTVGTTGDYGIKTEKTLLLYSNATGYHSLDADDNYMMRINYKVKIEESGNRYFIRVYDNSSFDYEPIDIFEVEGVNVSDSCTFNFEISEVNDTLFPIITITDENGVEHLYDILLDGHVESLEQHPKTGVVKPLGYDVRYPFLSGGEPISMEYKDDYGQYYNIDTFIDETDDRYYLSLRNGDVEVARFFTDIIGSVGQIDPSDVYFDIGSYSSEGRNCVIVTIAHNEKHSYYKIYQSEFSKEYGKSYSYVEETKYDPMIRFSYENLMNTDFGKNVPLSHRAYCSGMFKDNNSATFENLAIINIPGIGSCAGMFSGCKSMDMDSLRYLHLPTSEKESDYRGMFDGVSVTSVSFGGLTVGTTNIYSLMGNGIRTKGYILFDGMVGRNGEVYDTENNKIPRNVATSVMGMDIGIADMIEWS